MKIPIVTLAALVALIPFSSVAEHGGCHLVEPTSEWCTLNGVELEFTYEIEGTRKGDEIDCRGFLDYETIDGRDIGVSIYGNGGNDIICGSDYIDFIAGGGGNDTIFGGDGDDAIDGGAKDDIIYGGLGNDTIFGGVGASPASGVGCELQPVPIDAAAGKIYLAKGGSGDDTIYGGPGDDCINAGSGEDVVYGDDIIETINDGNDTIYGGNHADYIDGGGGFDHIDGGWHSDTCVNGEIYSGCESVDGEA
jgi:Ca2+-binding RTX toxin-like protein